MKQGRVNVKWLFQGYGSWAQSPQNVVESCPVTQASLMMVNLAMRLLAQFDEIVLVMSIILFGSIRHMRDSKIGKCLRR